MLAIIGGSPQRFAGVCRPVSPDARAVRQADAADRRALARARRRDRRTGQGRPLAALCRADESHRRANADGRRSAARTSSAKPAPTARSSSARRRPSPTKIATTMKAARPLALRHEIQQRHAAARQADDQHRAVRDEGRAAGAGPTRLIWHGHRVDALRVLSAGFPTRGHPIARSPRDGGPGVLGAKSTYDEMALHPNAQACALGTPGLRGGGEAPPAATRPQELRQLDCRAVSQTGAARVSDRRASCARPEAVRSTAPHGEAGNSGTAIPPRVFRQRVRVVASWDDCFEPRNGRRIESAARRAGNEE